MHANCGTAFSRLSSANRMADSREGRFKSRERHTVSAWHPADLWIGDSWASFIERRQSLRTSGEAHSVIHFAVCEDSPLACLGQKCCFDVGYVWVGLI